LSYIPKAYGISRYVDSPRSHDSRIPQFSAVISPILCRSLLLVLIVTGTARRLKCSAGRFNRRTCRLKDQRPSPSTRGRKADSARNGAKSESVRSTTASRYPWRIDALRASSIRPMSRLRSAPDSPAAQAAKQRASGTSKAGRSEAMGNSSSALRIASSWRPQ